MDKQNKHDVVIEAIDWAKKSTFKATALKVELEAQLNRGSSSNNSDECGECDEGWTGCGECYGDYDSQTCGQCDGSGNVTATTEAGTEHEVECDECEGSGEVMCQFCEEGRRECSWCDGGSNNGEGTNWGSERYCQDFLLEALLPLGLAELKPDDFEPTGSQQHYGKYIPKGALKYGKFYNDHSVDSEFTFTVSLEDSESVFLIPKIMEVWNSLATAIGNGSNVTGAGMHTAWLNEPNCNYREGQRPTEKRMAQFENFKRSMGLLLPAMFFLASGDEKSRGLRYRQPKVSCSDYSSGDKYSAIAYRNTALEFRAFNTCYDNPEQILDNIVVMRNCLKYWTNTYRPTGLGRVTTEVTFGNDQDDTLKRFYQTTEHIDLLNEGLKRLKPSYLTIKQVKAQRNFTTDKKVIKRVVVEQTKQAVTEYKEYEERFSWSLMARRARYQADLIENQIHRNEGQLLSVDRGNFLREIQAEVEQMIANDTARKEKEENYIENRLERIRNSVRGQYTLTA